MFQSSFPLAERLAAYRLVERLLLEGRIDHILSTYRYLLGDWAQSRDPNEVSKLRKLIKSEIPESEWRRLKKDYQNEKSPAI